MMRPRKRNPKFQVGQVVRAEGVYLRIKRVIRGGSFVFYDLGTIYNWTPQQLRPLTRKERGGA